MNDERIASRLARQHSSKQMTKEGREVDTYKSSAVDTDQEMSCKQKIEFKEDAELTSHWPCSSQTDEVRDVWIVIADTWSPFSIDAHI